MEAGAGRPEKKRRSKGRPRRHARDEPLKVRIRRIEQMLVSVAQETYGEMFGPRVDRARPFPLELATRIEPGTAWKSEADPSLEEQIREAVQNMAIQAEAYQPGRVYCYRCESSLCPHSTPPRPASVFGGYSSTGIPLWPDLSQALLELKHPDIDLLYESQEKKLVAAYVDPDVSKHRQLNVFGKQSKTYDILGQVVFGFLVMNTLDSGKRHRERVAFTLQAVECRRPDESPRLELNALGRLSNGHPAMDAFEGAFQERIQNIIASTRHRIRSLTPSSTTSGNGKPARLRPNTSSLVTDTLRKSARTLEKAGRQRGRRTNHAEEHRASRRPTSSALEDTLTAADDLFLWDEHRNTVVVVGPRSRVHVFSPKGRHITSLVLEAEAVKGRMRRKRWTRMTDKALGQFRASLNRPPSAVDRKGVS